MLSAIVHKSYCKGRNKDKVCFDRRNIVSDG